MRPEEPAASGWLLSFPEASSSNHGVVTPPRRGSTPSTNSASTNRFPRSFSRTEFTM
jgi:hypothetical protein